MYISYLSFLGSISNILLHNSFSFDVLPLKSCYSHIHWKDSSFLVGLGNAQIDLIDIK
jgi:hypothetical protein